MKINKKKKAFTLTELLVVVIIIGVLSAVVLPKFNKIMETRKTTEAEELMAAVRTEQEKRCALDKDYLTEVTKLTEVLPTDTTKNFAYTLTSTGIKAASKGKYAYELQMPSYADGRICCENEAECLKLNKDYPLCSELLAKADYDDGTACAGTTTPPVPPVIQCPGSATEKCGCNNGGERTRVCNTSTGEWSAWSACSISDECECTGTKPAASQTCNTCGTQTRTVTCNTSTGQWSTGSWGTCSKTAAECEPKEEVQWGCFMNDGYSKMLKQPTALMQDGRYMFCEHIQAPNCTSYLTNMNSAACSLLNGLKPGYTGTPTATAICKKQCGEDTPCEGEFFANIGTWGHSSQTSFTNEIPSGACSEPGDYYLAFNVYCYIDTEGLGNFMCPDNFPL